MGGGQKARCRYNLFRSRPTAHRPLEHHRAAIDVERLPGDPLALLLRQEEGCRRDFVLSYFGEEHEPPCGNCDNCDAGLVEAEPKAERPYEIGATVSHSEWGQGEVQRYDANRVTVLFESVGYRTLDRKLWSM